MGVSAGWRLRRPGFGFISHGEESGKSTWRSGRNRMVLFCWPEGVGLRVFIPARAWACCQAFVLTFAH
jgi:hypothetical protein